MNDQPALAVYANFMREIKQRIEVVSKTLKCFDRQDSLTGFKESDIELCFLQLRKCLELIMLSSLVLHAYAGVELERKLRDREWNATKIMMFLQRINPTFYPRAVDRVISPAEIDQIIDVAGGLTQNEFGTLYDRVCGGYLHASRRSMFEGKHSEIFAEIKVWLNKIMRLLNHHWIDVTDDVSFAVLMRNDTDGDVQVVQFERQE